MELLYNSDLINKSVSGTLLYEIVIGKIFNKNVELVGTTSSKNY